MLDDIDELEARGDLTVRSIVPLLMEPDVTDEELETLLALRDRRGRRGAAASPSSSSTA